MNLFSTILSLFGKGAFASKDKGAQTGHSNSGTLTDTGIAVNDDRALKLSAVWACVQYITNSVCSLPINFFEKTLTGRTELTKHYLIDLFHRSPNALMKPRDFRKAMTMQLVLWSNAYAEIFWNQARTRAMGVVPLRPGRMTPVLSEGGDLSYHYKMEQGVRVLAKESVLHLKGFSIEGITGVERLDYSRQVLGLAVSAEVYAAKQFAHGGRSGGGYLMFDDFLNKAQREQAHELYSDLSQTSFEKGKLWILEGGVKYEADTNPPDVMQMIETRKLQLGEIARFYGVPEVLIGAGGATSAWPASFEQQLLSFLTFTLQDYVDEWEHAINYSLLSNGERSKVIVDHDVSQFIKMDSVAKAQLHSSWVQNGLLTRNEIRSMMNLPRHEGADDLTVQVNLTPLEQLEKVANADQTI